MPRERCRPKEKRSMTKSLYDYCIENNAEKLLRQWDPAGNFPFTAKSVSFGSGKKIWWSCEKGHHWQAAVYSRTGLKTGCPYCTGRLSLEKFRSLATEYPKLMEEWHPVKNAGVSPAKILPGSHRKVWWRCKKGHEWCAEVKSRTRGTGCPYCTNRKVAPGENDLATTHPGLAKQWCFEKNGSLRPDMVVATHYKKVWWRCEKGHEWQATVDSRTSLFNGCPYCAGRKVLAGYNDLASSFADIAAQWHPEKNETLTAEQVTAFCNRRVWWKCEKGHEYQCAISQRTSQSTGCPYCTNRKVLAGFNDLETKEPRIAAQWHSELNGSLTPQMVTVGSRKKVWWQCDYGHVWKAVIYSRTGGPRSGCPACAGRTRREPTELQP